ncbi:MAG: 50S ribosomal protein L4 [Candidatus Marinimicrobia bacterium]|nr:50S ribosomal protein L4 [Candidatus Neomarinimicrobiota bacterium]
MELQVYKQDGSKTSKMKLNESVFGITPNEDVIYRAVQSELTNSRQGTHSAKSRGMVRGGGRKPFKQKGRGVARAGSTRSPLWRGGGTVFGPQPHGYSYKMPRKMKLLARRSILSYKANNDGLIILDEISVDEPKTKEFMKILNELNIADKKVTVLLGESKTNVFLAGRNIRNIAILEAKNASTYDLIDCDVILTEKSGVDVLTKQLMVQ